VTNWNVDRALINRRQLMRASVAAGLAPPLTLPVLAAHAEEGAGWTDEFDPGSGLVNVVTSVAPISSITRNVGGTRIALRGIVPDGTDAHTFAPAPSDAVLLTAADLVIVNGLMLEEPIVELATANLKSGAAIVQLGDLTISPDQYAFDFSFPESEGRPNPHLWLNIPFAMNYATIIAAELTARDGPAGDHFNANLTSFLARLTELDAAIMTAVSTIPERQRKLLTYHDSYAYFAVRYGMDVIGAVQPSDFSEPSPREVAALIDQIRDEDIPAVFGSEVFPSSVLEQIAAEAGANYVDELRDDALPGEPGDPEHTYVGMMLANVTAITTALGGSADALLAVDPRDTYV
jgi:ABC-type Zn uptake system ZnuABC Zn-binding protein ZnuA